MGDRKQQGVALITGGASGLGYAAATLLAKNGFQVITVDLPEAIERAKQESSSHAESIEFYAADISDETAMIKCMAHVKSKYNRLDVCINSAAIGLKESVYDFTNRKPHSLDNFRKILEVNLVATFSVLSLASGIMSENVPDVDGQRGVIINVSSTRGLDGLSPESIAYTTSKAAVAGMTLPLARELGKQGIRVACIAPGMMDTPMNRNLPKEVYNQCEKLHQQTAAFPKRVGHADEFARLVLAIIDNPLLNGSVIRLDAGSREVVPVR